MKRVSFKIAKAIKEAGYPQYGSCDEYYNHNSQVVSKFCDINKLIYPAPTYLEVWMWLWQEKYIQIDVVSSCRKTCYSTTRKSGKLVFTQYKAKDPEEAIITAIEYIIDNDLIK